ncbi:hypothetical protein ACKWTF_002873 [Chironomus riparius]
MSVRIVDIFGNLSEQSLDFLDSESMEELHESTRTVVNKSQYTLHQDEASNDANDHKEYLKTKAISNAPRSFKDERESFKPIDTVKLERRVYTCKKELAKRGFYHFDYDIMPCDLDDMKADDSIDELVCKICMMEKINIVLLPCKHVLGFNCCAKLSDCPYCHEKIQNKKKIVFHNT